MDTLYIVVPCYNEQECLQTSTTLLKEKLINLISKGKISKESKIVLVNDGSKDHTWEIISKLNQEDKMFIGIKLSHNKGHQNALMAGLTYASEKSDMCISIDADLQDDINAIDKMIDEYYLKNEIVYGVRNKRETDTAFKRNSAGLFYKLLKVMGIEIIDNHADFRLMSQKALKAILSYHEKNLFLRGIIPQLGFKNSIVYYERKERTAGESKYPLKKMIALAVDGITSFSLKPLRLLFFMGIIISGIAILLMLIFAFLFIFKILHHAYLFYILLSIWLVCGILMSCIGIVGEYVGKSYMEVKNRPRFIIEEILE